MAQVLRNLDLQEKKCRAGLEIHAVFVRTQCDSNAHLQNKSVRQSVAAPGQLLSSVESQARASLNQQLLQDLVTLELLRSTWRNQLPASTALGR